MTSDSNMHFAQQYQAALRVHLSGPSLNHSTSQAARLLGQRASESGMDVLELTRTHDQAMTEITGSSSPEKSPFLKNGLSPGGVFLLESLTSLEKGNLRTHHDVSAELRQIEKRLTQESARYAELLAQSRLEQEQSQQLAHQVLLAQEEERRLISRELHDEVAQILAGINVRLAALREEGVISFESFEQGIQQTQQMIEESVNVVDRYARKLRPALLDDLGLIPALRSFIKDFSRSPELEVHLSAIPEVEMMDDVRRTVLYRVAQEALLNIARHAGAHCATVRLDAIPKGLRLEVKDDGKSFSVDQVFASKDHKHLGLLGMKERVDMVGGRFSIESKPGKGTTIRADIPFLGKFEEHTE